MFERVREILRYGLRNRNFVVGGIITLMFFAVALLSYFWTRTRLKISTLPPNC